jgi:hypothetical protein
MNTYVGVDSFTPHLLALSRKEPTDIRKTIACPCHKAHSQLLTDWDIPAHAVLKIIF